MCKQAAGGRRKAGILGQRVDSWPVAQERKLGLFKVKKKKKVFFHACFSANELGFTIQRGFSCQEGAQKTEK